MLLHNEEEQREIIIKSSLLLMGIALNALEFFIPRIPIFPWLKPGLAHIVTLIWIIRYGFKESLLFAILRIWIVSFYFGFSFLAFALSISGSFFACAAMSLFWSVFGKRRIMGTVGVAIIGALFHNLGQIIAVYFLLAQNRHLFYQAPVMLIASVVFGALVGFLVPRLYRLSFSVEQNVSSMKIVCPTVCSMPSKTSMIISLILLGFCMSLVFVENYRLLGILAVLITVSVQVFTRGSFYAFSFPVKRFWLLFLFIGVLHCFFTYGTRVQIMPALTYEGIREMVVQWLRLWIWLETTFIFVRLRFHLSVMAGAQRVFSSHQTTLFAGFLAVELFPAVIAMAQKKVRKSLKIIFTNPSAVVRDLYYGVIGIVESRTSTVA